MILRQHRGMIEGEAIPRKGREAAERKGLEVVAELVVEGQSREYVSYLSLGMKRH